jgi:hypothetical protein
VPSVSLCVFRAPKGGTLSHTQFIRFNGEPIFEEVTLDSKIWRSSRFSRKNGVCKSTMLKNFIWDMKFPIQVKGVEKKLKWSFTPRYWFWNKWNCFRRSYCYICWNCWRKTVQQIILPVTRTGISWRGSKIIENLSDLGQLIALESLDIICRRGLVKRFY